MEGIKELEKGMKKLEKKLENKKNKLMEDHKKIKEFTKPLLDKLNALPIKERKRMFSGIMTNLHSHTDIESIFKTGVLSTISIVEIAIKSNPMMNLFSMFDMVDVKEKGKVKKK